MTPPDSMSEKEMPRDLGGQSAAGAPGNAAIEVADASSLEMLPDQGHVNVTALRIGMRLVHDLYDDVGTLLLAAGTQISPRFVDLLRRRNMRTVRARSTPPGAGVLSQSPATRHVDVPLADQWRRDLAAWPAGGVPRRRLSPGALKEQVKEGAQKRCAAKVVLADVFGTLQAGRGVSLSGIAGITHDFAAMVALDADLLPLVAGMKQTPKDYLFDHCVNVAMISMAVASQLGMNREQVVEVGMGGLLADVGMLQIPESIRLANRSLTADERLQILQHPTYTVDILERIEGLPLPAKFIGHQAHERVDGSGYPRRRSGMLIHQYAKIVAVADTYVAMTGVRPYRAPLSPYRAAKEILLENSRNKFDRIIVRSFLDCMSLFPVGSCVRLSDGRRGIVLRANPGHHTKPVIMQLDADLKATGQQIDLSKETVLRVVGTDPLELRGTDEPLIVP